MDVQKPKKLRDANSLGPRIVAISTAEDEPAVAKPAPTKPSKASESAGTPKRENIEKEKNPAAVALGRLGGLKGGKARAMKLSPEERARIAHLGALKRWGSKSSSSSSE